MKFNMLHAIGLALTAGLLASTSALRADTIKVGAPFNVTGALSSLDAPALNGAKLKAKEINDAGGINGKQIELVVYDTKTDPTVIASTASQLVGPGAGRHGLHRIRLGARARDRSSSRPASRS